MQRVNWHLRLMLTSLQARDADLPASPAGLLGRFAPSDFALASRSLRSQRFALRAHKNFRKKKSVSQSTQNALKRVKMQKKFFTPFDSIRASRVARSSRKF